MVIQCNMKITIETERLILRDPPFLCLRNVLRFKSKCAFLLVNNIVNSFNSQWLIEKLQTEYIKMLLVDML
jgi:hypothetical protein